MRHWPRAGVSEAPAAPGEAVVDGEALGLSSPLQPTVIEARAKTAGTRRRGLKA